MSSFYALINAQTVNNNYIQMISGINFLFGIFICFATSLTMTFPFENSIKFNSLSTSQTVDRYSILDDHIGSSLCHKDIDHSAYSRLSATEI